MSVADIFVGAIAAFTPELDNLYEGAKEYTLSTWELQQRALATASGAAAVAIPGVHVAGIAADLAFVVNRMGVSSFGVGSIIGNQRNHGFMLEKTDFGAVLGYWADDSALKEAMRGKGAADLSSKVGFKLATKMYGKAATLVISEALLTSSGYLIGQKLGGKAMAKVGAKVAAKFTTKAAAGFVPFLGPAVGGGINLWLISGIMSAAQEFYTDKANLIDRL